ncbi:MAG: sensor histidine kinase, partial [Bradyrhizobium sp.]|nr:sensor histidine kinase [Bradyrhizobium sp.]
IVPAVERALEVQRLRVNNRRLEAEVSQQVKELVAVNQELDAFAARLMTLSRAHDLLTQASWASAPIRDVVEGALAAHRTSQRQISTGGPDLNLTAKQALALAVAIHELATNATKYGALSGHGSVAVTWSDQPIDGVETFSFTWSESGGPAVTEPAKKGFGSRLIEKMLPNDFGGEVRTHYRPDGVVCELRSPLGRLNSESQDSN